MADVLSGAGDSEGGRSLSHWQDNWFSYQDYLNIHFSRLGDLFARGYVREDSLNFHEQVDASDLLKFVRIQGRLLCRSNVIVAMRHLFEAQRGRRNQIEVKGRLYSYHAWIQSERRRDLLRFDNAHGDLATLHRHIFDDTGEEVQIVPIRVRDLPHLSEIIQTAVTMAEASTDPSTGSVTSSV